MSRVLPVLVLVAAITAVGAAIGVLPGGLLFAARPVTTLLILVHAWPRGHETSTMRRFILAGLALSLVSDVLLLLPRAGLLPGLVASLLAILAYIGAFSRTHRLAARVAPFIAYGIVAALVLRLLWRDISAELRLPMVLYVVCLAGLAAQATVAWLAARASATEQRARSGAVGGGMFLACEALMVTDAFVLPLPLAPLWIMGAYWAAQWGIANSLQAPAGPGRPTSP